MSIATMSRFEPRSSVAEAFEMGAYIPTLSVRVIKIKTALMIMVYDGLPSQPWLPDFFDTTYQNGKKCTK
jgi:hypothetical protein